MAHYLDTSALVKLVVAEAQSAALRQWLGVIERQPVAGDLARTELMRAVRRVAPDRALRAREVLDSITLIEISTAIVEAAARLDPTSLRSLDAIHLATALELGDDLEALVTYDDRLASAARSVGLAVVAPS